MLLKQPLCCRVEDQETCVTRAAICSIVFHVDLGQQVECCYPPGALSPEELATVAFHAFPVRNTRPLLARNNGHWSPCNKAQMSCVHYRIPCPWNCTLAAACVTGAHSTAFVLGLLQPPASKFKLNSSFSSAQLTAHPAARSFSGYGAAQRRHPPARGSLGQPAWPARQRQRRMRSSAMTARTQNSCTGVWQRKTVFIWQKWGLWTV